MNRPPTVRPASGATRFVVLAVATLAFAAAVGLTRFGYTLILPGMQQGLGRSAGEMGLIAGLALTGYLVCSLPAGALATRLGTRRTMLFGLLLSAAGLAATGLAVDVPTAAAAQVASGGFNAATIVPSLSVGAAWFAPRDWGKATGVVVGGGGLGLLWAGAMIPLLLGPDPAEGWRQAWFGLGISVALVGLLCGLLLRDPPRPSGADRPRPPMRAVYGSGSVWQLGVVFLLYGIAYVTYGTFFAAHLALHAGMPPAQVGQLWSLAGVVGLGGGFLSGVLMDRLGPRVTLLLLFACQGIAEATLALGQSGEIFLFSALVYGLTVWCFAGVISATCALVVGPALAPAAVSLTVVMMSVGQLSGPIVGGLLADRYGSFSPSLLVAAGADVLGVIACALLRLRRWDDGG